jgi:hypothetical protein
VIVSGIRGLLEETNAGTTLASTLHTQGVTRRLLNKGLKRRERCFVGE